MEADGVDPNILDLSPDAPSPLGPVPEQDDDSSEEYESSEDEEEDD